MSGQFFHSNFQFCSYFDQSHTWFSLNNLEINLLTSRLLSTKFGQLFLQFVIQSEKSLEFNLPKDKIQNLPAEREFLEKMCHNHCHNPKTLQQSVVAIFGLSFRTCFLYFVYNVSCTALRNNGYHDQTLTLVFIYYIRRGKLLWRNRKRKPGPKKSRLEDFEKAKV